MALPYLLRLPAEDWLPRNTVGTLLQSSTLQESERESQARPAGDHSSVGVRAISIDATVELVVWRASAASTAGNSVGLAAIW